MSEADDVAAREFEQAVRRALDSQQRASSDGGPPTMPTEAVRQPSLRPDPGLPDPLSGRSARPASQPQPQSQPPSPSSPAPMPRPAPPVDQARRAAVPRPQAPSERPAPQPERPQRQAPPTMRSDHSGPNPQGLDYGAPRPRTPSDQPPFGYQPDHVGEAPRRHAGPGPGADHRRAVAEQWGDPRSARPPGNQGNQKVKSKGRRKRDAKEVQGNRAREAKWAANRWAVPYFVDGPKVTFGVLWFAFLMGGALLGFNYDNAAVSSVAVAVLTATIAALAGLQIGFAWFPKNSATRAWTAAAAFVTGVAGFYGPWGVVIGLIVGVLILTTYLVLYRGHRRTSAQLFDVLTRAAVPVGLASASLGAMAYRNLPVLIALILFVSAYEVGDFLVGSGAFNPVEGPLAGLIAAGVVAFFLFLIQPDPFSSETILMFVAVAAVSCVAGQYLGSALLPRGSMWAPALRRLDSYLLVAPLWLLLLVLLPDIH